MQEIGAEVLRAIELNPEAFREPIRAAELGNMQIMQQFLNGGCPAMESCLLTVLERDVWRGFLEAIEGQA